MGGLKSELLKYKRTLTAKLIVLIPLFFVLYAFIIRMLLPEFSDSWNGIVVLVFNWWPVLFLPLGMGLFATLVAGQEKKAGNYRALLAHPSSPMVLWYHKVVAMAIYSLLSTLVLIVSVILSGLLLSKGDIPINRILAGSFVCWLASLTLIPIQLWAATWKGVFLSMGIAYAGMMVGVYTAPETSWFAVPWSWATRLMSPIIGVHPNGILLESGNLLLDPSVIPVGVIISILLFLILTGITGVWFQRREVK